MRTYWTATETLRKRQEAHDMHDQGMTNVAIHKQMDIAKSTVMDWLGRPRPTDDDITAQRLIPDVRGKIGYKTRMTPEQFEGVIQEAERQGCSLNSVMCHSIQLYLDCARRARAGSTEPVNLTGYRR